MMRNKIDYYLKGIYGKIIRRVMRKFPVDVKMSLGDILLQRENITHPQFAISLLLLDIEKYLENGDASFFHKRTSQSLIRKDEVNIDVVISRFKKVIDSCVTDGFKEDSYVEIDKYATLMNGTHRTAICLYLKHYDILCKAFNYKFPYWKESADDFVRINGFDTAFAKEVYNKYEEIQKTLLNDGVAFCCVTENIDLLSDVFQSCGCHIKRSYQLKHRGPKDRKIFLFSIDNPDYIIKENKVISKTCLFVEREIKSLLPAVSFEISMNCLEGKRMFDSLKADIEYVQ
jgi:hypothetical protein